MRFFTDSETLSGTEATNIESHLNQALKDMASYLLTNFLDSLRTPIKTNNMNQKPIPI